MSAVSTDHHLYHQQLNVGSVYSQQLNVGSVYSQHLNVGSVYSQQLNVGSVYSQQLNVGSVYSQQLNVSSVTKKQDMFQCSAPTSTQGLRDPYMLSPSFQDSHQMVPVMVWLSPALENGTSTTFFLHTFPSGD